MLVVGAFWGRAGGLILAGLLALGALGGASIADHWDGERIDVRPLSGTALASSYQLDAGELVVDLTAIDDLDGLDGRMLTLAVDVGRIEVILPDGLDVRVQGTADAAGHLAIFGQDQGGIGLSMSASHDGGTDVPDLVIDATIGVGEVLVKTPDRSIR